MRALRLTNEELGALCTGLGHLYHAGISGADALVLLAQDEKDRQRKDLLARMGRRADEGAELGLIFEEQGCFPPYLCRLLKVAGQVGRTEQTLRELGEHYEGRARMEQRMRATLVYPLVLLAVMLAVVVVLLVWVLPVFNDVYARLGSRLTGLAGGLFALGQALRGVLPILCGLAAVVVLGGILFSAFPGLGHRLWAPWRARGAGRGIRGRIHAARFVQALALGLGSGMSQSQAVELALELARGLGPFEAIGTQCLARVEQGEGLAQTLRDMGLITAAHSRVLEAGLRAGRGAEVMEQLARRGLEQSEAELEQVTARVEPVLVVITCMMVGIILLSVMLPLMHIMSGIG